MACAWSFHYSVKGIVENSGISLDLHKKITYRFSLHLRLLRKHLSPSVSFVVARFYPNVVELSGQFNVCTYTKLVIYPHFIRHISSVDIKKQVLGVLELVFCINRKICKEIIKVVVALRQSGCGVCVSVHFGTVVFYLPKIFWE